MFDRSVPYLYSSVFHCDLTLKGKTAGPVRVTVTFTHRSSEIIFLRLVLGKKALTTSVTQIAGGVWQLEAAAPHPNEVMYPSFDVPLAVQALQDSGDILDSLLVGQFTYDLSQTLHGTPPKTPSQILMRTQRSEPGKEMAESRRVTLELLASLDAMCADFSDEEISIGRRLIRFNRDIDGTRLKVSCEQIKQREYSEGSPVISCIYRRDNGYCYFTSVDVICLLEGLVGKTFEIEEKNRIRRNLEGFHPETVSKNRKGTEAFFTQIMEFPLPKPRHIEKDVKVFHWSLLGRALDKIIAKYSLYTHPTGGSSSSTQLSFSAASPTDMGAPPPIVPSHPHSDAYRAVASENPSYPTLDPQTGHFYNTDLSLSHNHFDFPSPANMAWFSASIYPLPTVSPSPSESSSTASELHAVPGSSYAACWPQAEELMIPFEPHVTPLYHQALVMHI
ncbi:hypothetical protein EUX98_g5657 [Antrodiella citrinella]|uniref:DUF7082 domain-containing protein n=1 Tax=Antrodiella citrinella TaxID=2447956 RepID=A0A4S4MYP8_9APHY|nr:hypothetical protein EUX98_g5657 [Antrodiella citrinella]